MNSLHRTWAKKKDLSQYRLISRVIAFIILALMALTFLGVLYMVSKVLLPSTSFSIVLFMVSPLLLAGKRRIA